MAAKTKGIDPEAAEKRDLLDVLREVDLSDDALDVIEAQVKARLAHPAVAPKL